VAAKFEVRSPKAGQYTWVLISQGRTLATGEPYARKASAEKAIESMRQAAAAATVVDLTLAPAGTAVGAVARTMGRRVGRAVVKSGVAVERAERAVTETATGTAEVAKTVVKRAKSSTKKAAKKTKAATKKAKAKKGKGKKAR